MSADSFVYELLCVDSAKASKIKKAEQFAYSFMSNGELLHSPKFDTKRLQVSDTFLTLSINEIESSSDGFLQTVFLISVSGSYAAIEKARINIITHIKNQNFQTLYVLTDGVSEYIAQQIYPKINRVENHLRRYLIKFFATKLGADWWRLTADSDMQMKAQLRKNNEIIFAPHIDNRAYLIDFGELGKIVYAQSSGFISKDDIIKKILSMKPDTNAVTQLQAEIQSNYTKYFKETFKEASFQSKWEELEKIRHKVAHNNLFTQSDSDRALKLTEELEHIIEHADQQVLKIVLSADEREAIEDIIVESIIAEDKENISDWRTEIKNALQALNGEAELSEIYDYIRVHSKRELPNSWPQIIRYTIQTNSSDSQSFRGKSDIFKKMGKGRWALRTSEPFST